MKMRSYAQGSRSDCDDLIEQKPPRVGLHMRIFANEDHRKMDARPKRWFASSWVRGITIFFVIPLIHKVYSIKKVLVWGLTSTQ